MVLLVTGGAGFIGSNFIRYFLEEHGDFTIVNFDKLTYAGNLENLKDIEGDRRYRFIKGDICDFEQLKQVFSEYGPDHVINFAAESHVDRSIDGPSVFGSTNVMGALNLLECARSSWKDDYGGKRFLQISTDEVYGSLENDTEFFSEASGLLPNSPYSAAKAGADLMARAFFKTFGLPVLVTRCCNNYGPYQHREKLIPTCVIKALRDEPLPIYGNGTNVREWIHVDDHCAAISRVLLSGIPGEVYNVGSGEELSNIDMARMILKNLGKPADAITMVGDRPGHDWRYALDSGKIKSRLGWSCGHRLQEGLAQTVEWYKSHREWWDK